MNNRRSFVRKITAGLAISGLFPLFSRGASTEVKITGTLVHHVFFWLKEPGNPAARRQFEAAIEKLLQVKTIRLSHVGVPASTEARDVVDHTYTYSYMVFFNSKEDQDSYQTDPIHLKFVEENSHLWSKVVVYDSVDI